MCVIKRHTLLMDLWLLAIPSFQTSSRHLQADERKRAHCNKASYES